MTYQLTKQFGDRILPHRIALKSMSRTAGEVYMKDYMPDVEGEELEYALSLCGRSIQQVVTRPDENIFIAGMFLCGVSMGDLARAYNITRQAIQTRINRKINRTEKATLRMPMFIADVELIMLCRRIFIIGAEHDSFTGIHCRDVAHGILTAARAIIDKDREGDEQPVQPHRKSTSDSIVNTSPEDVQPGQLGNEQLKALGDML
jgi:hypothetical protein